MPQYQYSNTDLTPGRYIFVEGEVSFSRVKTPWEGAELEARNANALWPIEQPYNEITIKNARVLPSGENGTFTVEDAYINERLWRRREDNPNYEADGLCYTAVKKHNYLKKYNYLPLVFDENNVQVPNEQMPGELDTNLKVTIVIETWQSSRPGSAPGTSLYAVKANEPIRYFSMNSAAAQSALSKLGITAVPQMQNANNAPAQPAQPAAPAAPAPAGQPGVNSYAPAAPAQPAAQPVQPGYAPAQAAAPAAPAAPTQPAAPQMVMMGGAAPAPAPAPQPVAQQPVQPAWPANAAAQVAPVAPAVPDPMANARDPFASPAFGGEEITNPANPAAGWN